MKKSHKLLILLVLTSLLTGCDIVNLNTTVPSFTSIDTARHWIAEDSGHIKYVGWTGWVEPWITAKQGYGDCRGYAMVLAYVLRYQFPAEHFTIVEVAEDLGFGPEYHVVVELNGKWYSPQHYDFIVNQDRWPVLQRATYEMALDWCYRRLK